MTVFSALLSIRYIGRSLLVIFGYVLGSNIDYVAARVREELKIDQNRTQSPEKYYALSFRRFRIYGEWNVRSSQSGKCGRAAGHGSRSRAVPTGQAVLQSGMDRNTVFGG
jgi:hypothetical protein